MAFRRQGSVTRLAGPLRGLAQRNAALRASLLSGASDEVAIRIVPTSMFAWDFSSRMAPEDER